MSDDRADQARAQLLGALYLVGALMLATGGALAALAVSLLVAVAVWLVIMGAAILAHAIRSMR